MKDKDHKSIVSIYESLAIPDKFKAKGEVEGEKDHVIYIDVGDDVWEIDLKSDEHQEDHYNLLNKIKKFLVFYKNETGVNYTFLDGLLNSPKLKLYLKDFDTHPEEFLNKL